jgi:O-acetyl-ADP-ribose deacetylase (regulator of RNase III)
MIEAKGDIWQYAYDEHVDAVCVLTNMTVAGGRLIMGGGQAREAKIRFPYLPEEWGKEYSLNEGHNVVTFDPFQGFILVSLPTKVHPSDNSTVEVIAKSLRELVKEADWTGWQKVVLPRPGCGLGGLTWEEVKPEIEPMLDDRFIVITNV